MSIIRRLFAAAAAVALLAGIPRDAVAQGVTTGAISGTVTDAQGQGVANAQIQIVNRATGFSTGTLTRTGGRYFVQGLETGNQYVVTVRLIGYAPKTQQNVTVSLAQTSRIDFQLERQAAQQLTTVAVTATRGSDFGPSRQGSQTVVSDTALSRLPTINRQLSDFVRLTPQVNVGPSGRMSAAGQNNRFNNVQVDGVAVANRFGLGDSPELGAQAGGRSMSMEAVKEYQVVLSPFDARQGNFTGALVNAVTKSGTNDLQGSVFTYFRNQNFGSDDPFLRNSEFSQLQYGGSLGGPIIRDRLHYFVTLDLQAQTAPAGGPFVGQAPTITPRVPQAIIDSGAIAAQRFQQLTGANPGVATQVQNENPLINSFARLDWRVNDKHRLVFRNIFNLQEQGDFGRSTAPANPLFSYSSLQFVRHELSNSSVIQAYSNFANGANNEFIVGYTATRFERQPSVLTPMVVIQNVGGSGNAQLRFGTENSSQGNALDENLFEITNNYTIPLGEQHRVTVGTRNEIYNVTNSFLQNSYGNYTFNSIADFLAGGNNPQPSLYSVGASIRPEVDPRARFTAGQFAAYIQDQYTPTRNLTLTGSLRVDLPVFFTKPAQTDQVRQVFAPIVGTETATTSNVPSGNFQFSPRLGFNWDVTGDARNQLRGGLGIFQGTPAFVWMSNQYQNNGSGFGQLSCGGGNSATLGTAPAFVGDRNAQPRQCAPRTGGQPGVTLGSNTLGTVNLANENLRFPQVFRGVVGYDRQLPWNLIATVEGMYTRGMNDLFYVNRNIVQQSFRDASGRVMYGTLGANGVPSVAIVSNLFPASGGGVLEITNQDRNYSYSGTAQLRKPYADGWEASVAYTYSRSYSVTDLTSSVAYSNWQFGRIYSGSQFDTDVNPAAFDQPHRLLVAGTYTLPWSQRFPTSISGIYQLQSGSKFAYIYSGSGGRGDLNADGSNANDPIYIPSGATDPKTQFQAASFGGVTYTAQQQAEAFQRFVDGDECLASQRGRIMTRNSCENPMYANFDVTLRQGIPTLSGQNLALEVQIYNFLNFLNEDWGKTRLAGGTTNPQTSLLAHQANTTALDATNAATSAPIVTFDPRLVDQRFQTRQSAFDLWRMQVGVRYSF